MPPEETLLKRVIVESLNGICILNNPIIPATEADLREQFRKVKLPIFSFKVDIGGTALITVGKNYYSHWYG